MAPFNIGCGVSQLHIKKGDAVRFIPLRWNNDNQNYNDGVVPSIVFEPTQLFYPVSFPIKGIYDGTGDIVEIQKDANTEAIEKVFGFDIQTFCNIANCHYNQDNPFSASGKYLERNNTVEVEEKLSRLKKLTGMFILEDVYQMVINDSGLNKVKKETFEKDYAKLVEEGKSFFSKIHSIVERMSQDGKSDAEIDDTLILAKSTLNPLRDSSNPLVVLIPTDKWFRFNKHFSEPLLQDKLKQELFESWCLFYTMQQVNLIFMPNHSSYSYTSDEASVKFLTNVLEIAKNRASN